MGRGSLMKVLIQQLTSTQRLHRQDTSLHWGGTHMTRLPRTLSTSLHCGTHDCISPYSSTTTTTSTFSSIDLHSRISAPAPQPHQSPASQNHRSQLHQITGENLEDMKPSTIELPPIELPPIELPVYRPSNYRPSNYRPSAYTREVPLPD